jgi:thymidylate synthase
LVVRDVSSDFPYLQNRPTAFYKSVLETLFFLSGDSSYESMPEALCTSWWKPWASVAHDQKSWGRFYSTQWRAQVTETPGVYFDALEHLLQQMLEVITSGVENRKMVVSLWHTPDTLAQYTRKPAVLHSCHSTSLVFDLEPSSRGWELNLHHTQRSLDLVNGTGADLMYSGLVMYLIAQYLEEQTLVEVWPGRLVFVPVNVHVYQNHWDDVERHLSEALAPEVELPVWVCPGSLSWLMNGYKPMTIEEAKRWVHVTPQAKSLAKYSFPLNK